MRVSFDEWSFLVVYRIKIQKATPVKLPIPPLFDDNIAGTLSGCLCVSFVVRDQLMQSKKRQIGHHR
jgi:hypothetical protein